MRASSWKGKTLDQIGKRSPRLSINNFLRGCMAIALWECDRSHVPHLSHQFKVSSKKKNLFEYLHF
ncbi:hypothetical protein [Nostoc sp. FACHB-888]|uniref:hypothetical protein n=1 Tax=Nostoc sp. FACHB-888 TaxID=2692842 RepID=UPI001689A598|nr:hypothetical protein [Nostoc sp. FACHB-888]MBD2245209.1 hypothetical protein [Nostoc sp. FACHB-888]